jgi:hypothetical protein
MVVVCAVLGPELNITKERILSIIIGNAINIPLPARSIQIPSSFIILDPRYAFSNKYDIINDRDRIMFVHLYEFAI